MSLVWPPGFVSQGTLWPRLWLYPFSVRLAWTPRNELMTPVPVGCVSVHAYSAPFEFPDPPAVKSIIVDACTGTALKRIALIAATVRFCKRRISPPSNAAGRGGLLALSQDASPNGLRRINRATASIYAATQETPLSRGRKKYLVTETEVSRRTARRNFLGGLLAARLGAGIELVRARIRVADTDDGCRGRTESRREIEPVACSGVRLCDEQGSQT